MKQSLRQSLRRCVAKFAGIMLPCGGGLLLVGSGTACDLATSTKPPTRNTPAGFEVPANRAAVTIHFAADATDRSKLPAPLNEGRLPQDTKIEFYSDGPGSPTALRVWLPDPYRQFFKGVKQADGTWIVNIGKAPGTASAPFWSSWFRG